MSQNVLSVQSSRRGAAERQRRWRARQRVRRETEDRLRQRLGRAPTEMELRDEVEAQLTGLGLAPAPVDVERPGSVATRAAEGMTDTGRPAVGDDHDQRDVDDHGGDLSSAPALRDLRLLSDRRRSTAGPPEADGAAAGRAVALAGLSLELLIAAERDRIFTLLMQRAEEGDASALLFLASRLAPPARPRRVIAVPEILALDLGTSEGTQRGIEVVLAKVAAGGLALDDADVLLRGL